MIFKPALSGRVGDTNKRACATEVSTPPRKRVIAPYPARTERRSSTPKCSCGSVCFTSFEREPCLLGCLLSAQAVQVAHANTLSLVIQKCSEFTGYPHIGHRVPAMRMRRLTTFRCTPAQTQLGVSIFRYRYRNVYRVTKNKTRKCFCANTMLSQYVWQFGCWEI